MGLGKLHTRIFGPTVKGREEDQGRGYLGNVYKKDKKK